MEECHASNVEAGSSNLSGGAKDQAEKVKMKTIFAICLMLLSITALAETWAPSKPINIIVPLSTGSAADVVARGFALALKKQNIRVTVENRPGAEGAIAVNYLTSKQSDPHVVMVSGLMNVLINHIAFPNIVNYNHTKFKYVASLSSIITSAVAHQSQVDIKTINENTKFGYAAPSHILALNMLIDGNLKKTQFVGYKDLQNMFNDVARNDINYTFSPLTSTYGFVKSGRIKLIGVGSSKRLPEFPDAPTLMELNKNFTFEDNFCLLLNNTSASAIVDYYRSITAIAIKDKEFVDLLQALFLLPTRSDQTYIDQLVAGHVKRLELYTKFLQPSLDRD